MQVPRGAPSRRPKSNQRNVDEMPKRDHARYSDSTRFSQELADATEVHHSSVSTPETKTEIPPSEHLNQSRCSNRSDSVIQWETAAFYTFESEVNGQPIKHGDPEPPTTEMTLGIVRLGSSHGISRVRWNTFDKDAIAGKHYVEVAPQWVEFLHGETHVDVTIAVKPNSTFDGTVEFGLFIDEGTAENASVGKYLRSSCVKIIDYSSFPTDALRLSVMDGNSHKIAEISSFLLVLNFLWFCWSNPVTRSGSIKTMLAHQWHSLVVVTKILVIFFVVRMFSRAQKSDHEKNREVLFYGLLWVGPFLISHALNYSQQFWRVSGSLKAQLHMLLLKKFLNYTDDSRSGVGLEKLMMTLVRDVTIAVSDGYSVALDLVFGTLVRIGYLVLTVIYIQAESGASVDVRPIVAIFAMPFVLAVFLYLRQHELFRLRARQFEAESAATHHVINTVLNYQLIQDYDRTSHMIQDYNDCTAAVNARTVDINSNIVNSGAVAPWLTTLLVGGYIMVGGSQVVAQTIPLATFLSTISLFQAVGGEFEKAYTQSLALTNSYASISQLTVLMNLPVDVPLRRKVARSRRRYGRELRDRFRDELKSGKHQALSPDDLPVDILPIELANVSFSYLMTNPLRVVPKETEKPEDAFSLAFAALSAPPGSKKNAAVASSDQPRKVTAHDRSYDDADKVFPPPLFQARPKGTALPGDEAVKQSEELRREEKAATKVQTAYRTKKAFRHFKRRLVQEGGSLKNFSLHIPQGQIVALLGPPTSGKSTILRLLANQIFPNLNHLPEGPDENASDGPGSKQPPELPMEYFVPPHLRVVQVSETPMILGPKESIYDNLIFGIKRTGSHSTAETDHLLEARARAVMARLQFTPTLLDHHFKQHGFIGTGGCRLTRTNRQLISLGRALVMNPEVLVVHKPEALFHDSFGQVLMDVFREFVDNRGVCMPDAEPLSKRRRRTLIFTPTESYMASKADIVFEAKDGKVTRKNKVEENFHRLNEATTATNKGVDQSPSASFINAKTAAMPPESEALFSLTFASTAARSMLPHVVSETVSHSSRRSTSSSSSSTSSSRRRRRGGEERSGGGGGRHIDGSSESSSQSTTRRKTRTTDDSHHFDVDLDSVVEL